MNKTSDWENEEDINPFLHGALVSKFKESKCGKYFALYSSFSFNSKFVDDFSIEKKEKVIKNYIKILNLLSNSNNWISWKDFQKKFKSKISFGNFSKKIKAIFLIENDLNWSSNDFYRNIFSKIFIQKYLRNFSEEKLSIEKINFIRGFFELRSSLDFTREYFSLDLLYNSEDKNYELNKISILSDYFSIPSEKIDFNFRELQSQFISGENKRNTQIRINLYWYIENIGILNNFKSLLIEKKLKNSIEKHYFRQNIFFAEFLRRKSSKTKYFQKRLVNYKEKILGTKLSDLEIKNLRKEILDINEKNSKKFRNKQIIENVKNMLENKCYSCLESPDENYLSNRKRTFLSRTGSYYFEMHHNISLGQDIESLDLEDNLVKLCIVCHKILSRNIGIEKDQKEIIEKILKNLPNVKSFSESFFGIKNDDIMLISKIYESLK